MGQTRLILKVLISPIESNALGVGKYILINTGPDIILFFNPEVRVEQVLVIFEKGLTRSFLGKKKCGKFLGKYVPRPNAEPGF